MRVASTSDVEVFLASSRAFLETRPVEHNLVMALADVNRVDPLPSRCVQVSDGDGRVVGCLIQSPDKYLATVTPMPPEAVQALVDHLRDEAPELPGMNGEATTVACFAGAWATARRIPVHPEAGQRLYELGQLAVPDGTEGRLRPASGNVEVDRIVAWLTAFDTETGNRRPATDDRRAHVQRQVDDGHFWFWEAHGEPVSMAFTTPILAGAARIGAVYTPPEHRSRGFARICVASISAQLLASGADHCLLYTQLTNPHSNHMYQQIGYQLVAEILSYRFGIQ